MRPVLLFLFASTITQAQELDLVKLGNETFHGLGCAECHSETKNDPSIKTGPSLFGLLQKTPRNRDILAGGERHRQTVKADQAFFTQAVRKPNEDLAIAEGGATAGQPYLPVMPPYDSNTLSDFKLEAIYHYLLTLNDEANAGPTKVIREAPQASKKQKTIDDPFEILVTDQTRIYRTRLKKQSARAVYVGTPQGLNYAFDPASLSIERIWWGGFLNLAGSLDGRGQKPSSLGHQAKEVDLTAPLLAPLHPDTNNPIDLSFKSPRHQDYESIAKNLNGEEDFAEQLATAGGIFLGYNHAQNPSFQFQVGENSFELQFIASASGEAKLTLSGNLKQPQTFRLAPIIKGHSEDWTVHSLPAELTFTLPVKASWRPSDTKAAPHHQKLVSTPAPKIELPQGLRASQIAAPHDPHGREQLFEPLGIVQSRKGGLIVATRTAGVWTLKDQQWTLVAEGLQDCLGIIEEEDGSLIVGQKPELTRLTDTDGDGIFDHYQTLSEAFLSSTNYHEYLHGPAKGSDGNYYIALNLTHHHKKPESIHKAGGKYMGTQGGYRGWALQITPDGVTTPFANGLRSPAGLSTGPDGQVYYTENQGEFVGTSKLFHLQKDKFYGHPSGLVDLPNMKPESKEIQWEQMQNSKEKALALFPHSRLANAPGSPAWAPQADTNHLFVGDQTLSTLFEVRLHPNNEAALIPYAKNFPSGLMRLVFDQNDDLYIGQTGRGWRAQGGSQHALTRIERTKTEPANRLETIVRNDKTFTLTFKQSLTSTPSVNKITVESWTYLDAPNYGSPENDKTTHPIENLTLSSDHRSVVLQLKSIPSDDKNRVFSFSSLLLPFTKVKNFEAFYSIVGQ